MKTLALIVARLGSTRLPRKALLPVLGKPLLERLIERVRRAKRLDGVAVATTTLAEDDALEDLSERLGIACFRGSPANISERLADAALVLSCDALVELLGDNPLVHADLIDETVALFHDRPCDYAATLTKEYPGIEGARFPVGVRVQVLARAAAQRWKNYPELAGSDARNAFIFTNDSTFRCAYLEATGRWAGACAPEMTFAVNIRKNYELIERIFADLHPRDPNFTLPQVMDWLKAHPDGLGLMGNS